MKVTVELDATPQEMRTMLGLPDVEPMQQEIIEKTRENILSAIESNDPANLMRMFMPTADHFKSIESMQTAFWEAMSKSMGFNVAGGPDKK